MFYSKISLESDLSKLSKIESFLDNVMQQFGVDDGFSGIVKMPLYECVENAIVHGNKCDKSKKVHVDVQLDKSKLLFSVTDEGQGFDYSSFLQKNLEHQKKNGLFKVKLLTDDLSFSKNGSQVSYKGNVPFSLPTNSERIGVLQQSQKVAENVYASLRAEWCD
jgi:serine/threonine-protein kinase RsbW